MALSDRHLAFIDQYMIDQNGTQAILRAKLADNAKAAGRLAWQYFRVYEVREEIDRRIAERRAATQLTVTQIETWLREYAELDVADLYDDTGELRPFAEWPVAARRAVQSIETEDSAIYGMTKTKVKLIDKKAVIELLGKHKKMFTEKLEVDANVRRVVTFTIKGPA